MSKQSMVSEKTGWRQQQQRDKGQQRRRAKSAYLGHDLLAIKMKLRASTVMQRSYGKAELIAKTGHICASISTCHCTSKSKGCNKITQMSDGKSELNNNSTIDECEDRLSYDAKNGLNYVRNTTREKFIYTGNGKQQPIDAMYLGQAAAKRRLVEAEKHITESHQFSLSSPSSTSSSSSSSSSSSTSSYTVPDSTTTCHCRINYHNATQHAAVESPLSQLHSPLSLELTTTTRYLGQPRKLMSLGELNVSKNISASDKHMPWFGIDVGGTLIKVVFFDPKEATRDELVTLKRIRRYLKSAKAYGTTGKRDTHLEMSNCVMNGREGSLHFIRFATSQMPDFLTLAKDKKLADTIDRVCATGGGAYKFEDEIRTNLGISLTKTDELDSIIYGIHYIDKFNSDRECYFLEDPLDDEKCVKVPYNFSQPYPYLVVNIGSGVSILAVYSSTSYSRISGSSIGGGTFLGLCSLLTQCETFDEAIQLAEAGSSFKIDKLVKDIYGGDYPKFNLSGDTVASNFGHMNLKEKHKEVSRADLARGLLEMVTINIGSIARMCAANENIDRVVFIGNFLRVNQLSMKLLSYAVNYWSKGAIKALFLEHEGYFGAVGCFVESTRGH